MATSSGVNVTRKKASAYVAYKRAACDRLMVMIRLIRDYSDDIHAVHRTPMPKASQHGSSMYLYQRNVARKNESNGMLKKHQAHHHPAEA